MSRRKQSRQARRRQSQSQTPRPGPRRWLTASAVLAGIVALGVTAVMLTVGSPGGKESGAFPRPPDSQARPVRFEDFLGSEACRTCHGQQFSVWSASTHGRAGGPPTHVTLLPPFDGTPIQFRDAVVRPMTTEDGRFVFAVQRQRGAPEVLEVTGVIGGGHMVGGGTQGFVTQHADGTVRFLPFDYSAAAQEWFCNTLGRRNEGWLPITPDLALADCADWPPVRVLGSHRGIQNCQQCHGSQILLTKADDASGRFGTRYTSLAVNCESCHGPGRRHVELMERGAHATTEDIGMRSLATLSTDESLAVCFQCHSLKTELTQGYLPGAAFEEYFSVKLPILIGAPFFPDGRVRTFAYQGNHLASACYYAGSMTCTDCHDPHAQTYRNHVGTPLDGRFADGQCLSCHPSKADTPERHTRHAVNSAGSRCVACHMPYLQHPLVGNLIRYARSDHTISIPRPGFDTAFRITGACRQCHETMLPSRLDSVVEQWYGPVRSLSQGTGALLDARRIGDLDRAADLVLPTQPVESPLVTFAKLSHFFLRYVHPDMAELPERVVQLLSVHAHSNDDDVAALALAGLHLARGSDPTVRLFLEETLYELGPRHVAVRRRWVAVLVIRGRAFQVTGDLPNALATYRKVLDLDPDNVEVAEMLATFPTRAR